MNTQEFSALLLSDFTIEPLARYLNNSEEFPTVHAELAPFAQVIPTLMNPEKNWDKTRVAIIWTQAEAVSDSFRRLMEFQQVSTQEILNDVDIFCDAVLSLQGKVPTVFVPNWTIAPHFHQFLGMKSGGIQRAILQMNLRLAERLDAQSGFFVMDSSRWIALAGKNAYSPKSWFMGKVPFSNDVFRSAALDIQSALAGIAGKAKKLIILDLDDTLWGGIVGDDGWQNLKLGGHDPIGESFIDFQKSLKSLTNRGIILGIVSKNTESVALEAIEQHPEMILRKQDFAGWKINWQDKARNIADLVAELNLGLDSAVFLDDNPVERARVRESLPEVFVPELPADKLLYTSFLQSLRCFDTPILSKEDAERTKMYVAEREREEIRQNVGSLADWLKTLEVKISVEELNEVNLQRTAQLLNKTNQMNLSTRRMTEAELWTWANQANRKIWTFRVSDKFGDSGLTGIVSVEWQGETATMTDYVLSCRVMGKNVEESMLFVAVDFAQKIGIKAVEAKFLPTAKNKPCLEFWERSGFQREEQMFRWNCEREFPHPEGVEIVQI